MWSMWWICVGFALGSCGLVVAEEAVEMGEQGEQGERTGVTLPSENGVVWAKMRVERLAGVGGKGVEVDKGSLAVADAVDIIGEKKGICRTASSKSLRMFSSMFATSNHTKQSKQALLNILGANNISHFEQSLQNRTPHRRQ
jgi:hypothetical protein